MPTRNEVTHSIGVCAVQEFTCPGTGIGLRYRSCARPGDSTGNQQLRRDFLINSPERIDVYVGEPRGDVIIKCQRARVEVARRFLRPAGGSITHDEHGARVVRARTFAECGVGGWESVRHCDYIEDAAPFAALYQPFAKFNTLLRCADNQMVGAIEDFGDHFIAGGPQLVEFCGCAIRDGWQQERRLGCESNVIDHGVTLAHRDDCTAAVCSDWVVEQHPGPTSDSTIIVLLGPTGVGKSELSLEVAAELDGEIVNADSMQLYRGMDIGTAKLPSSQRRGIPHHVLDVWELDHLATVAEYQTLARKAIAEIQQRGRVPILVGGSGLYINATVDAMEFPGVDPVVRARWEAELERIGPEALHEVLAAKDPTAAAKMEPRNGRRIVRALEVIEITGAPYNAGLGVPQAYLPTVRIGLRRPRIELDALIERRVVHMWESGWVDEVKHLLQRGLSSAPTASRALGYSQITAMLAGEISESEAVLSTTTATRRFVRRQHSWFDRDGRINWLDLPPSTRGRSSVVADALSLIG